MVPPQVSSTSSGCGAIASRSSFTRTPFRLSGQRESEVGVSGRLEDVLLAVDFVADGIRAGGVAHEELPQGLPGVGVEREEVAFVAAAEDQPTGGAEHGHPRRSQKLELPTQLSRCGLESANRAVGLFAGKRANPAAAH